MKATLFWQGFQSIKIVISRIRYFDFSQLFRKFVMFTFTADRVERIECFFIYNNTIIYFTYILILNGFVTT